MRTDKVEGFNLSWQWTDKTHTSGFYDENQSQNLPTTRYYYDGQMAVEDDNTVVSQNEPVVTVMRYGIGARGIDFLAKSVDGGAETKGFPLYDGHGNMIATLGRSDNSPYFGVADLRSYDVWGAVRSGSSTGDPKQRYCANLGHIQDDESGLVYMRARYYEPWSGRFISEDPARDGFNYYSFAENDPINRVDYSGTSDRNTMAMVLAMEIVEFIKASGRLLAFMSCSIMAYKVGIAGISFLLWWFGDGRADNSPMEGLGYVTLYSLIGSMVGLIAAGSENLTIACAPSIAQHAISAIGAYVAIFELFLLGEAMSHTVEGL